MFEISAEKIPILDEFHGVSSTTGISIFTAAVFLVGEMAGTGVMALPKAIEGTGLVGLLFILLACTTSCYTGHLLGNSWIIVQSRYEEYRGHVRHPYPTLAYVTYGKVGRTLLSLAANISMFGSLVIFLILSSENIQRILNDCFGLRIPFCLLMMAVAACITPMTWFGTPKDFWPIALGATVSTSLAVALCMAAIVWDTSEHDYPDVTHTPKDPLTFFESLGTILFSSGGHFAFLTFQNDMKQPARFGRSLVIAYVGLALLYVPIATLGYVVYGSRLDPNILLTLEANALTYVIIFLVTCHQIFAFVIALNPMAQHLEEVLNLSKDFSPKRALLRSTVVLLLLFVAESVPKFGFIVSLIGGSAYNATMLVAPPVFYLKLSQMKGDWVHIEVPVYTKILFVSIILSGIVIGSASTFGSFQSLWGDSATFTLPCYINMTAAADNEIG